MSSGYAERAAVILAAGASSRMGRPKALVEWGAGTFLSSLLDVYAPFCAHVVVVAGAHTEQIKAAFPKAEVVLNPAPERGQFSSLQCGLAALPPSVRLIFFQPVDAPGIAPQTLRTLAANIAAHSIAVPCHGGRHGHPVLITRDIAAEMLQLPPHATARDVLQAHRQDTAWVDVDDPAVLRDIDDAAALHEARA